MTNTLFMEMFQFSSGRLPYISILSKIGFYNKHYNTSLDMFTRAKLDTQIYF